jgi:hypothetical protein
MAHIAENDKLTGSNYTGTLLINKTKKIAFMGSKMREGYSEIEVSTSKPWASPDQIHLW